MSEATFHNQACIVIRAIEWEHITDHEVHLIDSKFIEEDGANSIGNESTS